MWIEKSFVSNEVQTQAEALDIGFVSLRNGKPLWITRTPENGGTVCIDVF